MPRVWTPPADDVRIYVNVATVESNVQEAASVLGIKSKGSEHLWPERAGGVYVAGYQAVLNDPFIGRK